MQKELILLMNISFCLNNEINCYIAESDVLKNILLKIEATNNIDKHERNPDYS